ncbi:helix-turn-helix transcriptional regulator [Thermomonospora umbrina]|uniref:Regulatory LuxR family protein n=1 Tax=Thermomonospora umbrina TaxID=111806 RepID=A0A3D9T5G6_9ACTN|nr:AAA family ATPase [Thermomonospora umbrina]REE99031.1 regulatory LuxR family protein [Thermomonospora umbrina]
MLIGRGKEQVALDRQLTATRSGKAGALVIRGEPGVGKSAMLDYAAEADGFRVVRAQGSDFESELPFAGLHMLLGSSLDRLPALPEPQAQALGAALGATGAAAGDRFLVGLAVLSLLAELAEERPVLCLVDDAQWWDRASVEAMVFAARRLDHDGVMMVFAVRDAGDTDALDVLGGLPELHLSGLDREAARALLARHSPELAPAVRDRILKEADGNPLALIELPAGLEAEQRSGRPPFGPQDRTSLPLPGRLQRAFGVRAAGLSEAAGTLLLTAAAEETGDLDVVVRAAARFGAGPAELLEAEQTGLLLLSDGRLAFRHPLARAAVLQAAPVARRMMVHRALAAEIITGSDDEAADRAAWHLASAATGPDEQVAARLEEAALRAETKSGFGAQAAALERAAELTPDRDRRAARLVCAAEAAAAGGDIHRAAEIAGHCDNDPLDGSLAARLACVRATVEFDIGSPLTAGRMLFGAATDPERPPSTELAASMLVDAIRNAYYGCDPELATQAASALMELVGEMPLTSALMGLARLLDNDWAYAIPRIRAFTEEVRSRPPGSLAPRERLAVVGMSLITGDERGALTLLEQLTDEVRDHAMVGWLPVTLKQLAFAEFFTGRMRDARAHAEEGLALAESTGQAPHAAHLRCVLAWFPALAGDERRCRDLVEAPLLSAARRQDAGSAFYGMQALVLLESGLGQYRRMLERFDAAFNSVGGFWITYCAPDQIEAAVRIGQPGRASESLEKYIAGAHGSGQSWAQAVAQRCLALTASGDAVDEHYRAALDLHRLGGRPFEEARTTLLYGEYLRRSRRKAEARTHLRAALETFERFGAVPWAERARAEIRATGVPTPSPRLGSSLDLLTPQELQVVRLAALGMSNRDIAIRLFLSPRTVGYHLYKAFPKLGVSSRSDLSGIDFSAVA